MTEHIVVQEKLFHDKDDSVRLALRYNSNIDIGIHKMLRATKSTGVFMDVSHENERIMAEALPNKFEFISEATVVHVGEEGRTIEIREGLINRNKLRKGTPSQ